MKVWRRQSILEQNQYPPQFYDPIIEKTITKIVSLPTNERKCNEPEDQDGKVMVFLPYRGQITDSFVKKLKVSGAPIQPVLTLGKLKTVLPSLKPTTKHFCSFYRLRMTVMVISECFYIAKLNFFSFIAGLLVPYLTCYQTQNPMILFLHDDLQKLLKELLGLTIKSEVIDSCKDDSKVLLKIDLRDVKNHIKKKDMHVGFATLQELQSLRRKDLVSQVDVNKFRVEVKEFVVVLLEKMFCKNPISYNFVKYASIFDPKVLLSQPSNICKSLCGKLMCFLVGSKIVSTDQADKALSVFSSFYESCMSERKFAFKAFDRSKQRLDEFFMKKTDVGSYKNLLPILKLVLVLSHGQANVERCFSVNNSIL